MGYEQQTEATNSPVWDQADLAQQLMGNTNAIRRIAALLVKTTQAELNTAQSALAQSNLDSARSIAHSIKGSSSNFRAWALHHSARRLEDACTAKDMDCAKTLLQELEANFQTLQTVLESEGYL